MKWKWCTYSWVSKECPQYIGRIGESRQIEYSEDQIYPAEYWDTDYIKLFDTLNDAIQYMIDNDHSLHEVQTMIEFKWFKESKHIDWSKYG